jgi:5-methylcytosine-specific restriction enzyme subunit McrC
MFFAGIEETAPTKTNRKKLYYNRNNMTYRLLISIAIMLYDNTTINEEDGQETFKDFFREEHMQKVYEMFLLNFYAMHLDRSKYRVYAPKFTWIKSSDADIWDDTEEDDSLMPELRTDIVIENKEKGIQLIIDAKYYAHTTQVQYDVHTLHSNNLYQIFTYVKHKATKGGEVSGMLLYAKTDEEIYPNNEYQMSGNKVTVRTLDLNCDFEIISAQLNEIASSFLQ